MEDILWRTQHLPSVISTGFGDFSIALALAIGSSLRGRGLGCSCG